MSEQMDIVVIADERKAEVRTVDKPVAGRGEVLMRIEGCALCTFEQRMFTGEAKVPKPFIGGHEIAGVIEAVGEGLDPQSYPIGKRIAARTFYSCGHCYGCRHDKGNLCENGDEADKRWMAYPGIGGLQQYMPVKVNQLYFLADDLPLEEACLVEPLACVLNSIEKGNIDIGDDVVVIGGGIMGQLHVKAAKVSGTRVIMSEPDAARRALAEQNGADITIDPTACDVIEEVKKLTGGYGAAAVFNTTAVSAVAQQAVGMVAPMGTVVMYSSQHPDRPIEISPGWLHSSEANITGAVSPSVRSYRKSVDALSKGIIKVDNLVSAVFDYHDCQEAFEMAVRPDTFRIIIKF